MAVSKKGVACQAQNYSSLDERGQERLEQNYLLEQQQLEYKYVVQNIYMVIESFDEVTTVTRYYQLVSAASQCCPLVDRGQPCPGYIEKPRVATINGKASYRASPRCVPVKLLVYCHQWNLCIHIKARTNKQQHHLSVMSSTRGCRVIIALDRPEMLSPSSSTKSRELDHHC